MHRKHFGLTRHPFSKEIPPDELFVSSSGRELEIRLGHLLELPRPASLHAREDPHPSSLAHGRTSEDQRGRERPRPGGRPCSPPSSLRTRARTRGTTASFLNVELDLRDPRGVSPLLPPKGRSLWRRCELRRMNIGIEAGDEHPSSGFVMS